MRRVAGLVASAALVASALVAPVGCAHTHLERNAPGNVDVLTPPKDRTARQTEVPDDPGERLLVLSAGAFGGLGWGFYDDDVRTDYSVGPELGLAFGSRTHSHYEDDFFVLPERAIDLRLGVGALDRHASGIGPAFAELGYSETLLRASGGWAWDADDALHGPQATLAMGPLYLRGTHLLDTGTSLHLGVMLYGTHTWVWSQ